MTVKLNAATGGGSVSLSAPNSTTSNADVTLTLPPNDGDANQVLSTNGSGVLSFVDQTTDTGVSATFDDVDLSGSTQLWTGIPSTAYRIVIAFQDMSFDATANVQFHLGTSSGLITTGYYFVQGRIGASGTGSYTSNGSSGFVNSAFTSAASAFSGTAIFTKANNNRWIINAQFDEEGSTNFCYIVGRNNLGDSNTLERIRISPSTGSFDQGNASILYYS